MWLRGEAGDEEARCDVSGDGVTMNFGDTAQGGESDPSCLCPCFICFYVLIYLFPFLRLVFFIFVFMIARGREGWNFQLPVLHFSL